MSEAKAIAERPADQLPAATSIMEVIERASRDPAVDVDKLERLMAMAERADKRAGEMAFNESLSEAQGELTRIAPNAENTSTKSKYPTYAALDRVVRPIYIKHGFSLSFDTGADAAVDHVLVLCHVSHKQGHTRTYRANIPCDGKGAKGGDVMTKTHAVGAAMSYGSRYLLKQIFNIAVGEDDDDGNGASNDPITPEQLAEINDMLGQCNGDPEKFCKFMKVDALSAIQQKDMGKAREALNMAINDFQRKHPKAKS